MTKSVADDTAPETRAPKASARDLASARVIRSKCPVNTRVLPEIALSPETRATFRGATPALIKSSTSFAIVFMRKKIVQRCDDAITDAIKIAQTVFFFCTDHIGAKFFVIAIKQR